MNVDIAHRYRDNEEIISIQTEVFQQTLSAAIKQSTTLQTKLTVRNLFRF